MSHWTTRRLLASLADMLMNALATRRVGEGDPVRLLLSPRLAERIAAAAEAAAGCPDSSLDAEPPAADPHEEETP